MSGKIFRRIPRPDVQAVKLLGELGVAHHTRSARPHWRDAAVYATHVPRGASVGPRDNGVVPTRR